MNFGTVSDCIGGFVHKDGQEYCLFHFPTENRTLAYNPALQDWSEWAVWDSVMQQWNAYDFRSVVRDLSTGKTFIGKKDAQVIACLSSDSRVDLTGAATTTPFKFLRKTGHINHGTLKKKRVEDLRMVVKRGTGLSSRTPKLMLRYKNDGSSTWSNIREIDLGDVGETEHHISLYRMGMFKSRQYELSVTDNVPIVFGNAEIDLTIIR